MGSARSWSSRPAWGVRAAIPGGSKDWMRASTRSTSSTVAPVPLARSASSESACSARHSAHWRRSRGLGVPDARVVGGHPELVVQMVRQRGVVAAQVLEGGLLPVLLLHEGGLFRVVEDGGREIEGQDVRLGGLGGGPITGRGLGRGRRRGGSGGWAPGSAGGAPGPGRGVPL